MFRVSPLSAVFVQVLLLVTLSMLVSGKALATTTPHLKTLYSFCSADACVDGLQPTSGLISDADGNLYGVMDSSGGTIQDGIVYALLKQGNKYKFRVIHKFCEDGCSDGQNPFGTLIIDVDGNLYGTTSNAGANNGGTVFKLRPSKNKKKWKLTTLYSFCYPCASGGEPVAGLTYQGAQSGLAYDGKSSLYGVTLYGGANSGGVAFQLSFGGKKPAYTVLHDFCLQAGCSDGKQPESALIMDTKGNLFGTTRDGGSDIEFSGTVFELSPAKSGYTTTTLYRFCQTGGCTDGMFPRGTLNIDSSGNLIGTTVEGGRGAGTFFRISPKGENSPEAVIYNFCSLENCADGGQPQGASLDQNGDLVGVTYYGGAFSSTGGTVFRLHKKDLTTLYSFCAKNACTDGERPVTGVALDAAGDVFGVTDLGGKHFEGSVFELMP
jgi:uncharacterized repeat protein (TIGR03803 family)